MKRLLIAFTLLAASYAAAVNVGGLKDLGKQAGKEAGKAVGQKAEETALQKITKKLKNVQNEKGPIRFKKGKAEVDPKCDKTMQSIADILAEFPGFRVEVDGHTDNKGKPETNLKLSQDRADAVVKYLVEKKGVDPKRLTAKGFGDTAPMADNKTEAGRAKNRRVDFTVTKL